jgi:hypothetical protein
MTVITSIKEAFQDLGYSVETRLQESAASKKQIIIIVDEVDYEVETDTSYFCNISLKIIFVESDPELLIEKILTFPNTIEIAIRDQVNNPIIESPDIDNSGHLYQVEIYVTYTEVINIE